MPDGTNDSSEFKDVILLNFAIKKFMDLPAPVRDLVYSCLFADDEEFQAKAARILADCTNEYYAEELRQFIQEQNLSVNYEYRHTPEENERWNEMYERKIPEYFRENVRYAEKVEGWSWAAVIDPVPLGEA